MSVVADPRTTDALFAAGLKLFATPEAVRTLAPLLAELGADAARLFVFSPADDGPARLRLADQSSPLVPAPLPHPPSGCCALVAIEGACRDGLTELLAWWTARSADGAPSWIDLAAADEAGRAIRLAAAVMRARQTDHAAAIRRATELRGELAALRQEHEQLRRSMDKLLAEQERLGRTQPALSVVLPPIDTHRVTLQDAVPIVQPLAVSAEGLAGVDLHLARGAADGPGMLLVSLYSREEDATLAAWRIDAADLHPGWLSCRLDRCLSRPLHYLDLIVEWRGGRAGPTLSCADVGLMRELLARRGDAAITHALCHALWSGLPESPIPAPRAAGRATLLDARAAGELEYTLSAAEFAKLRPLASAHFPFCHTLPDVPGFRLHPLNDALAAAILPDVLLPGTCGVVATAEIRCADARHPVEFALCAADAGRLGHAFAADPDHDEAVRGWSGWQSIPADGATHPVTLRFETPLERPADLFFATRMADGREMTHHWADWLEVRIALRPATFARPELVAPAALVGAES